MAKERAAKRKGVRKVTTASTQVNAMGMALPFTNAGLVSANAICVSHSSAPSLSAGRRFPRLPHVAVRRSSLFFTAPEVQLRMTALRLDDV